MNKKLKTGIYILLFLLVTFQILVVGIASKKNYYLIYDWIFYAVNYLIIIIGLYIYLKSRWDLKKITKITIAVVLLVINTTLLYKVGSTNLLIEKSKDNKHELILKEYENMNFETLRLKRRALIFGRKVDNLDGSSIYKALENKAYKIDWASDDNAVLTYQSDGNGNMSAAIYNYRLTDRVSYSYVLSSIQGKWVDKENKNNYLFHDREKLVYSKDGKIYYYDPQDATQYGILGLVLKQKGNPAISIVINSDSEFGEHDIVKPGGSITVVENSLEESKPSVFYKEK